jgi:hypothetical protein
MTFTLSQKSKTARVGSVFAAPLVLTCAFGTVTHYFFRADT